MKTNHHTALLTLSILLTGILLVFLVGELKGQGPLDPPGPPAPGMKSLDDLSNQIAAMGGFRQSTGRNILSISVIEEGSTKRAAVMTPSSRDPIIEVLGPEDPDFVVESNGSFLVIEGSMIFGFSANTNRWHRKSLTAPVQRVASSKGATMAFATSEEVWVFRPSFGAYVNLDPGIGVITHLVGSD